MANVFYNEAKTSIVNRNIDLAADTIKVMLVNSVYTANADHQFIDEAGASDAVDARLAGTTDQTLGTKVIGKDNTGDFAYFDAADSLFSAVTTGQTAVAAIVYKDTGTPTTSKMICYLDITDTPTNGGDITLQYAAPASGAVFKLA
jgi:hypothetical protein